MKARIVIVVGLVVILGFGLWRTVGTDDGPDRRTDGGPAPRVRTTRPMAVGLWGDIPYTADAVPKVERMIGDMNAANLDFSVFDGDIKGGGRCDDRVYTEARDRFNRFVAPLVYVPGDNEWTDCHGTGADPLERLAHLRQVMFPSANSLGMRAMALERQSDRYPEHTRWRAADVVFAGLHVVGSNDNKVTDATEADAGQPRAPRQRAAANAEHEARSEAAVAWMRKSFRVAKETDAAGVMVVIQADPAFDVVRPGDRAERGVDGFDRFLDALREETKRFARPVALVHGDTHRYRLDHPLLDADGVPIPNLVRLETFGYPFVSWVKATVDPNDPLVFRFERQQMY